MDSFAISLYYHDQLLYHTMQPKLGTNQGENAVRLGASELSFLAFQRFTQLLKPSISRRIEIELNCQSVGLKESALLYLLRGQVRFSD